MRKAFIKFLWGALISVFALLIIGFIAIWNGWVGYMPDMEDLQNPISRSASQIFSADGKVMGTWNASRENRIMVDYNKLSPDLVRALVATEDERFYEHSGIDFIALGRAIVKRGLMGQASAGGGSTITQQLAKQLYTEKAKSTLERIFQKPIEWVIAIKLERNFTKEEIVAMYLNYFDFLHNAVGIKTASNTYFNKEPKELTLEESATLIDLAIDFFDNQVEELSVTGKYMKYAFPKGKRKGADFEGRNLDLPYQYRDEFSNLFASRPAIIKLWRKYGSKLQELRNRLIDSDVSSINNKSIYSGCTEVLRQFGW